MIIRLFCGTFGFLGQLVSPEKRSALCAQGEGGRQYQNEGQTDGWPRQTTNTAPTTTVACTKSGAETDVL